MSWSPTFRYIHAYVHQGRIGVLVEIGTETMVVTTSAEFQEFAQDLAMHIAASNPIDVVALVEQPFVKDQAVAVGKVISNAAATFQERVCVTRFVRWDHEPITQPELPAPPRSPAVIMQFKKA
jgi:elongation factor Ts